MHKEEIDALNNQDLRTTFQCGYDEGIKFQSARVKELEEALGKIVGFHGNTECGFCGSLRIATQALAHIK